METYETIVQKLATIQRMTAPRPGHGPHGGPRRDASRGQGRVLALLKLKDGVSTRDLAHILGIRVPSLNETLARMERDGLAERRQSPEDGRVMLVYLTEKGRAAEGPDQPVAPLLAGFSEEDLVTLGALLDRMIANLEAAMSDEEREALEQRAEAFDRMFGPEGPEGWGGPVPPMPPFPGAPMPPHHGPHGHHGPEDGPRPEHHGPEGHCGHHGPHGPEGRCGHHGPHGERPEQARGPEGHHRPHGQEGRCGAHGHHGPHGERPEQARGPEGPRGGRPHCGHGPEEPFSPEGHGGHRRGCCRHQEEAPEAHEEQGDNEA